MEAGEDGPFKEVLLESVRSGCLQEASCGRSGGGGGNDPFRETAAVASSGWNSHKQRRLCWRIVSVLLSNVDQRLRLHSKGQSRSSSHAGIETPRLPQHLLIEFVRT